MDSAVMRRLPASGLSIHQGFTRKKCGSDPGNRPIRAPSCAAPTLGRGFIEIVGGYFAITASAPARTRFAECAASASRAINLYMSGIALMPAGTSMRFVQSEA
jgi:hypothetical protein